MGRDVMEAEESAVSASKFVAIVTAKENGDPSADRYYLVDLRRQFQHDHEGPVKGAVRISVNDIHDAFKLNDKKFREKFGAPKPRDDQTILLFASVAKHAHTALGILSERYRKLAPRIEYLAQDMEEYLQLRGIQLSDDYTDL